MKKNILLFITIIIVFSSSCFAQKNKLASADKKYDTYAYIDAIKTYERLAEKGYKSADMFQKLGNAYYFNAQYENAAKWYGELFGMNPETESEYYYRFGQSLKAIGVTEKANQMLKVFRQKAENDTRVQLFNKNKNYLEEIKANSGRYKIKDAGINSKYSDYGSSLYLNKLVFASARDTGSLAHRKHRWNNQYFTNLYVAELGDSMTPGTVSKLSKNVNTKFHEASPVFSADGKSMYFTRNNYIAGKKGTDTNDITLLKIYKASLENDKWTKITALPFSSDQFSTAHPALSPDGKILYFSSDMPGTMGQSDLFKVKINEDGSFSNPENLGNTINTEARESFPYLSDENELYFASDGHPGLGGLDIFVTKINADGSFGKVQNIGADANSPKDDFAFLIDTKSRRGFLSSNRDGGQGFDDIYKFLETKKLICEQELYGEVTDIASGEMLPDTKISLFDTMFNLVGTTNSDQKGLYSFMVDCRKTYNVRAEKAVYTTKEQKVTIAKKNGRTQLPIALEKATCKVAVGDDLGKCFGIKMIYFDFDKSDIRVEAALDLEKILDVLNQYPNIKLDIRSHTDSRGSFKYNEALSYRRAQSTIKWLIQNGVKTNRLSAKGYGESQLVNKCADGLDCTEEEYQLNRRSEFIIMEL